MDEFLKFTIDEAYIKAYEKDSFIFRQDELAQFYFEIITGSVKVYSTGEDGKTVVQGIFYAGDSFGEPPLLLNKRYPSTAVALTPIRLYKVQKNVFVELVAANPAFSIHLLKIFAKRLYNKSVTTQILNAASPEERMLAFLDFYKLNNPDKLTQPLPFTRKQIAESTGLRVETVIRTLLKLAKENKIFIKNHKVYLEEE